MMKTPCTRVRSALALVLVSILSAAAAASQPTIVAGVELPATVRASGRQLALASCGVRDTLWIEHYVAALYVQPGQPVAQAMRDAAQPMVILMYVVRGASLPEQIPQQWREPLREELKRDPLSHVRAAYGRLGSGDRVRLTYGPNEGVSIAVNGHVLMTTPGHDLMDSMLHTWAGRDPLSGKLQRMLLEHPC